MRSLSPGQAVEACDCAINGRSVNMCVAWNVRKSRRGSQQTRAILYNDMMVAELDELCWLFQLVQLRLKR